MGKQVTKPDMPETNIILGKLIKAKLIKAKLIKAKRTTSFW
jgi:hypothetical protein